MLLMDQIKKKQDGRINDFVSLTDRSVVAGECRLLRRLENENLLSLLGLTLEPCGRPWLVFQYGALGDLCQFLQDHVAETSPVTVTGPVLRLVQQFSQTGQNLLFARVLDCVYSLHGVQISNIILGRIFLRNVSSCSIHWVLFLGQNGQCLKMSTFFGVVTQIATLKWNNYLPHPLRSFLILSI